MSGGRDAAMSGRVVGIDLGTTHSVLAWTDEARARRGAAGIEIFRVPQLVSATEMEARELYPSFLYAPVAGEKAEDPWGDAPYWTGAVARRRGTEVPGRSVASAKSWLGYAAVDRTAAILPWSAEEDASDLPKISPVDASAKILGHLRAAFDAAFADGPGLGADGESAGGDVAGREAGAGREVGAGREASAGVEVVLTVPASFDEDARELTVEAARRAGLTVRLLEEPQAAFYDYAGRAPEGELSALVERSGGAAHVLVCDIGGGTTDLSLLRVEAEEGAPAGVKVTRIAVGNHLLLGGDNMDLALAHACEGRLVAAPDRLPASRFAQLVLACRAAKERLLGESPPDAFPVAVAGQGSKLLGSTLRTDVSRAETERLVLDGFFPRVAANARPVRGRSALVAFGLPYEKDPAITRHIAGFLARHGFFAGADAGSKASGSTAGGSTAGVAGAKVDAVLFNGGVFRAKAISERLIEVLSSWSGAPVVALAHTDPDLAVARGAVAYGLALRGHGLRIQGGSARGHYVGLSAKAGEARQAVCVVPRGAEEGVRYAAPERTFALALGRSVRFDLFTSDSASHAPGDVVTLAEDVFEKLPPIAVRFDAGAAARSAVSGAEVRVAIEGELSAVGTLDLACVEAEPQAGAAPRRFKLAFQLRDAGEEVDARAPRRVFSEQRVAQATEAILRVFGKGRPDVTPREVKDLFRELEKILGERSAWTMEVARALFDALSTGLRNRKRSSDHERVFWQIAGYCLRPGFGDPGDAARAALLAPLFVERLTFQNETRLWQQFWIAWRRIAGGLDESSQLAVRDAVDPFLAPAENRLKKPKGWKPDALPELLDMVSSLERVPAARRAELGAWILEKTWTDRDPRWWGALGRIGARVPAYASVHHVVSPQVAERWLDQLLRDKWDDLPTAPGAAVQLARVTGDRARDVSPRVRAEVERRLQKAGARDAWIRAVREYLPVEEADRAAFFGEGLPIGLRLIG
ncbi:MAG: Hsp70 family protein [Polyangiaceae bacterium]